MLGEIICSSFLFWFIFFDFDGVDVFCFGFFVLGLNLERRENVNRDE